MIVGIFGPPGAGKSLEGVRQAGIAHDRGDTHVYSNTPLVLERFTIVTPLTLSSARAGTCPCKCKRAFVLLDEVHLWLPARRSMQLPISWLALFSQTRKRGWDLFYTAQAEKRVDVMLRDVTEYMVLAVAKVVPVEYYVYHWFPKDDFRDVKFRVKKDVRRRSRRASALYETLYELDQADHLKDARDPYAASAVAAPVVPAARAVVTGPGVAAGSAPRPALDPVVSDFDRVVSGEFMEGQSAPSSSNLWRF